MKNRSRLTRCLATVVLSLGLVTIGGAISTPAESQSAGLGAIMQSFMGAGMGAGQQQAAPQQQDPDAIVSVGGNIIKQSNQASSGGNISLAPPKASRKAAPEYRGYNGRTVKQAYFGCKYESYRAAAPGARSQKIMEKMRIRMYVMDACMNKEGFFRKQNQRKIFDVSHLTAADFGFY